MSRCPTCPAKKPMHKLLCWKCWALVPADQQQQVFSLWKTAQLGRTASIRHMAMEEYRKAREAAIAAVRERPELKA